MSTIVIAHQLTSIAKPYRENVSSLVTFYNPSAKDSKVLLDDYLASVDNDERSEIMKKLKNNDYARLEVALRRPYDHPLVVPIIKDNVN